MFLNIHTHKNEDKDTIAIINRRYPSQVISSERNVLYSIGVHPWDIESKVYKDYYSKLFPIAAKSNVIFIGEAGLDKFAKTSLEIQVEVFKTHVQLSEKLRKPLIIHCVRYFNELVRLKNELNPEMPWIIHGFNNKIEIANQLLKHGVYFSFGKALLDTHSNASQIIHQINPEYFFLETDDSDISIKVVYKKVLECLNVNEQKLVEIQQNNFRKILEKTNYSLCIQGQNYSLEEKV